MLKNFQSKCLAVFKTVYLKMLWFYQLSKRILAYFQKSKTPSVIPFWKAILIYFKVARSIGHFSGHFKWLPWWSGSIYKKWLPRESIEARVLKFCVGLCMTNTHARKKERLNPRTKIYFDTPYWLICPDWDNMVAARRVLVLKGLNFFFTDLHYFTDEA